MAVVDTELPGDVIQGLCAEAEDPDAALAKLFQEQEHAWFLAYGGNEADFDGVDEEENEADDAADGEPGPSTADNAEAAADGVPESADSVADGRCEMNTN